MKIERRFFPLGEARVVTEEGKVILRGHAAVFNSQSADLGGFREIIRPNAFRNALTKSDPRCLFNHVPSYILGRKSSNTLRVSENERGLPFDCDLPDTTYARDLQVSLGRGDVRECSFGFSVREGGDTFVKDKATGVWHRTIIEDGIEELYDVSPVTFPAYPETDCALRSLEKAKAMEIPPPFNDTFLRKLRIDLLEASF